MHKANFSENLALYAYFDRGQFRDNAHALCLCMRLIAHRMFSNDLCDCVCFGHSPGRFGDVDHLRYCAVFGRIEFCPCSRGYVTSSCAPRTKLAMRHQFGSTMVCIHPWSITRHSVCRGISCGCWIGAVISRIHHPPRNSYMFRPDSRNRVWRCICFG